MLLFMNTRDFAVNRKVDEVNKQIEQATTPEEIKTAKRRAKNLVKCFMKMDKALAEGLAL